MNLSTWPFLDLVCGLCVGQASWKAAGGNVLIGELVGAIVF